MFKPKFTNKTDDPTAMNAEKMTVSLLETEQKRLEDLLKGGHGKIADAYRLSSIKATLQKIRDVLSGTE